MGGRGGSSGMTSNRGYTKDGTIKQNGEKMFAERMTGGNIYGSQAVVLEATTDGNGNLTLEYAQPVGYRQQNSKTSYAQYELKAGLTNRSPTGKTTEFRSNNIDWDKVKTVSGKTYGTQYFMRQQGFSWDSAEKKWKRKK